MQSPTEQLKELLREWLDLELVHTCTAGDQYTRLSMHRVDDVITFSSRYRGKDTVYLTATKTNDDFVFTSPVADTRQWISQAQYCIELTLNSY